MGLNHAARLAVGGRNMRAAFGLLIAAGSLSWVISGTAHADLLLTLRVNDPDRVVGPFDTVSYTGTLTNDAASTEPLFGDTLSGAQCCLNLTPHYEPSFGTLGEFNLFDQFEPVVLQPGSSFTFDFLNFTPNPAPVPLGRYDIVDNILFFGSETVTANDASITVAIPEPASLALLVGLLVGLPALRALGFETGPTIQRSLKHHFLQCLKICISRRRRQVSWRAA